MHEVRWPRPSTCFGPRWISRAPAKQRALAAVLNSRDLRGRMSYRVCVRASRGPVYCDAVELPAASTAATTRFVIRVKRRAPPRG
jgi:hypothetical protein